MNVFVWLYPMHYLFLWGNKDLTILINNTLRQDHRL